jgi:NADPH2:quinone reductase
MSQTFNALRVNHLEGATTARVETLGLDALPPGEVTIRAHYSSVNYKDALAITGQGRILARHPLTAGIDVAGEVDSSSDARFSPGQPVLVTGYGLGVSHDGGMAGRVRVPADWVVPLPAGWDARAAMTLGTAGFTAALSLHRMEQMGQHPELGPVLITGATGGVGSVAVALFTRAGYRVTALTGKAAEEGAYLRALGAQEVLSRHDLALGKKPLESVRYGGAVDSVGGELLAWITRVIQPWGSIAACGLAGGWELNTTVMPFILRGVSLLGINSVDCPAHIRHGLWTRLAASLTADDLALIRGPELALHEAPDYCRRMLAGGIRGRALVRLD